MSKTTFFKRPKKVRDFTTLDCTVVRMPQLSWKAKGLHTYLMQLPEDWVLSLEDLINRSKDGRDSTKSAIRELEKAGLFVRKTIREKGKFSSIEYLVYERPTVDGFSVDGKTVDGKTANGESDTTNRLSSTNELFPTKDEAPPAKKSEFEPPTIDTLKAYFLERIEKVPGAVGAEYWAAYQANQWHEKYSEEGYRLANGRPMKSWKGSVRTWVDNGATRATYCRPAPGSPDYGKFSRTGSAAQEMPTRYDRRRTSSTPGSRIAKSKTV